MNNSIPKENQIDLRKLIKLLIESKKMIVIVTFFFTLLGLIFFFFEKTPVASYTSSALIEIGAYDDAKKKKLIESPNNLIQELIIRYIYKQTLPNVNSSNLSIQSIENKLINISYTSASSATSENVVNEIIKYIRNRHSLLLNKYSEKDINQLTNDIKLIDAERNNNKLLIDVERNNNKLIVINEIHKLENRLPTLNDKIISTKDVILMEKGNLTLLQSSPSLLRERASQSPTLDQIIFSYRNKLIDIEFEKREIVRDLDILKKQLKEWGSLGPNIPLISNIASINLSASQWNTSNFVSDGIFSLKQSRDNKNAQLETLIAINLLNMNSQLIRKVSTQKIVKSKQIRVIYLFLLAGLFASISSVFIQNFLKTFKEEKA